MARWSRLRRAQWLALAASLATLPPGCRLGYELLAEGELGQDASGGATFMNQGGSTGAAPGGDAGAPGMTGGTAGGSACDDGERNGSETDVDCGGDCPPCEFDLSCDTDDDCESAVCAGGQCARASCLDGVLNQGEAQVDCGGPACPCCNPGAFGAPERIEGITVAGNHYGPALSADSRTMFFSVYGPGTAEEDLFVATRSGRGVVFSDVQPITELNTDDYEGTPFLSADGLAFYFMAVRADGTGGRDLYFASRDDQSAPFGSVRELSELNSTSVDQIPSLTPDELTIVFASQRSDGLGFSDIWMSQRASVDDPFDPPTLVREVSTQFGDDGPFLSTNGLTLFLSRHDPTTELADIMIATRENPTDQFGAPVAIDIVNSPAEEFDPFMSPDGTELFFASDRGGSFELYRSERECL